MSTLEYVIFWPLTLMVGVAMVIASVICSYFAGHFLLMPHMTFDSVVTGLVFAAGCAWFGVGSVKYLVVAFTPSIWSQEMGRTFHDLERFQNSNGW